MDVLALATRRAWMRLTIVTLIFALGAILSVGIGQEPTHAAQEPLLFPAPAGQVWSICCGYNTSTHTGIDPHAIDLVRLDGPTAGSTVLAPISGQVRATTSGSSCITIRDSSGLSILMCHIYAAAGLRSGDRVTIGQIIATVAPAGEAANNGLAHIHLAVHRNFSGGTVQTVPFTGNYILDGVDMPDSTAANAYAGQRFTSTNVPWTPPPPTSIFNPGTATPGPRITPTTTPAAATLSVTSNDSYAAGMNSSVVIGGGSASSVAARIGVDSRRPVLALWVLSQGRWLYFLPSTPDVPGGLTTFPATPTGVLVVLG